MRTYLDGVAATLQHLPITNLTLAVDEIRRAKELGACVFVFGNGGSAATASHFVNDLVKMARVKAYCISDMSPTVLAYGNDDGWENMFKNAIEELALPGDVLVAISCSGNSPNVVKAIQDAHDRNQRIIGLTGDVGGQLAKLADVLVKALHPDIRVQEDVALSVCHAIVGELRNG